MLVDMIFHVRVPMILYEFAVPRLSEPSWFYGSCRP